MNKANKKNISIKDPSVIAATWFGCGFMKPAPGTWGTLGALPFGVFLMLAGGIPALLAGICIITPMGFWASDRFEEMSGEKDSSMIVIDEVTGMWIALIPAAIAPLPVAIAFILFRAFDIVKPWPVSYFDKKLTGAISVMGDDIVAGIFAAICLLILQHAGII